MTTAAASLSVDVSANLAKLYEGLTQATSAVNRSAESMKSQFEGVNKSLAGLTQSFTNLGGVVSGIAGALGVGAFAGMITSAIEGEAALYRLAQRTGASVESLSAMRDAARVTGVEIDNVAIGMQRFAKNIVDATSGTGKAAGALQQLGFNSKTFATEFKSTDQAILAVAQALDKFEDGPTKTAAAMALLGRNGAALIPFLHQIATEGLSGVTVTREQAKAAEELVQSWTKLVNQAREIGIAIANVLIPVFQALIDNFKTVGTYAAAFIAVFVGLPAVLGLVTGAVGLMTGAWVAYREAAIGAALANEVLGASTSTFDILGVKILDSIAKMFTLRGLMIGIPAIIVTAFAAWKLGDWLQENIIDFKLFGIEIVEVLLVAWENVKTGALKLFEVLKAGFMGVVNTIRDILGGVFEAFSSGFTAVGMTETGAVYKQVAADVKNYTSAITVLDDATKKLDAENAKAIKGIKDITGDLKTAAIQAALFGKANADANKKLTLAPPSGEKPKLDTGLDAYYKAVTSAMKVELAAQESIVQEGIKLQETELERSYQRGLVSLHEYLNQKIALQKAAQASQETLLADEAQNQGDLVTALVDRFQTLSNTYAATTAEQNTLDKERTKTLTELETAYAAWVKAQAALNVAQMKGTEIGKNYLEELIKGNAGVLTGVKAMNDSIAAAERENEAIGLTKDQIILLNIARIENIKNMELQSGVVRQDVIDALDAEIAKTRELANVAAKGIAKQQWVQGWSDLFRSAADEGAKFIEDFVQHGSSAFKNLWNDFKTWALEAIAKIAAQQIVLSIVGSISPGLSGTAANALTGSGGPLGSILSSLGLGGGGGGGIGSSLLGSLFPNSIGNTISNGITTGLGAFFGGSTAGLTGVTGSAIAAETGGLAAGMEAGLTAAGTAAETAALSLGTLVPVVGLIAVAGYALYTYLQSKKGGAKVGGEGGAGTSAGASLGFFPGETTTEGNKTAEQLATAAFTTYSDTLLKLGGKNAAGTGFYFGFDTDPKGTAASRALSEVQIAGNTIFKNINTSIGRSPEELQAALQTEANRAVLGALQNSDLPKAVTNVLNSVVAATASDTDISAVEALAEGVKSVLDTLKNTMPTKFAAINAAIENINFTGVTNKMQAVFSAAFGAIDPALKGLIDNFKGTDTEVAAFGSTLLTIYDTTNKIAGLKFPTASDATGWLGKIVDAVTKGYVPGAGLSSTVGAITAQGVTGATTPAGTTSTAVDAAVADYQKAVLAVLDGTQATADKVLVFVQTILAFGDAINGVGADLHNLDPKYITAFIDALGGAQAAAAAFTYLQNNFTTAADKTAKANADLTKAFADLGLAVPASHQAFLDLLNSFDLTTDAGRALYASVIALAPAFVAIAGTADQAAKAIQDAAGFFAQNFYSETEKNTAKITAETAQLDAAQAALGVTIPHTVDGFRALIESLDRTTPAGEALYEALIVLAPAVLDVSKGVAGLASSATSAATAIAAAADTIFGSVSGDASDAAAAYVEKVKALADQIPNAGFGDKLTFEIDLINKQIKDALKKADDPSIDQATRNAYLLLAARLGYTNNQMVNELARFTVLTAQYGSATAEQLVNLEDWYAAQKNLFNGDAVTLAALDKVFKQRWDDIIKGISDGVGGSIDQLTKLRQAIADYLKGLSISELSPLTPAQKLAEAQRQYQDELAKAAKGDPTALADITKYADAYLKQARDFYASGSEYTDIFKLITDELAKLAGDAYDAGDASGHGGGFGFKGSGNDSGAFGSTGGKANLNDALLASLPNTGQRLASAEDIAFATKALSKVIVDSIAALADSNTSDAHHVTNEASKVGQMLVDNFGRNLK